MPLCGTLQAMKDQRYSKVQEATMTCGEEVKCCCTGGLSFNLISFPLNRISLLSKHTNIWFTLHAVCR